MAEWYQVQQRIGDKWAASIARAYRNGVYETDAKTAWGEVEKAIPSGPLAVYNQIQWNTWNPVSNLTKAYGEMYNRSQRFLQKYSVKKEDISLEFGPESFTMPNPAAEAWLMSYSATEITGISQQNMDNIRQILYRGQRDKKTYKEIAKQLRSALGLNSKQEIALYNYTSNLKRSGKTDAQVKTLGDKYYNKLLRYRSETVALTESHTATNKAWSDSVKQAVREDVLDPNVYALYWLTAIDERRCPQCAAMSGEEADLNTQSFGGQGPPPIHPRCRCCTVVRRKK